eukprot:8628757-Pyramimonas_sp.AAC.1
MTAASSVPVGTGDSSGDGSPSVCVGGAALRILCPSPPPWRAAPTSSAALAFVSTACASATGSFSCAV